MAETHSPGDTPMSDKRHNERSPVPANMEGAEGEGSEAVFKVFVGGISRATDENELFSIFRQYNPKEVMIMRELATQRPRGFGFITFATQKDMDWAIRDMHNTRIDGRVVTVSKARPFERPRGDRSPRRPGSPERRPSSRRDGGGDWTRDYPRRYQPHSEGYNGQRSFHDTRRRSYEPPMASRRYSRDDPHSANQMYSHSHYDSRNERGDYGGGGSYDGRRGGYRAQGGQRNDDYYHRSDPSRQGQWMDYDRRQQMRDREEGHRRWNQTDRDRRHYNNNYANNNNNNGREANPRWRSPDMDDRRREGVPRADSRDDADGAARGGGHYGDARRRSEVRRVEPYRHRSRSPPPDRRGR